MSTNGDIWFADELAEEFLCSNDEIQKEALLALAEYEISGSFEEWCRMGRDYGRAEAEDRWRKLHTLYMRLWWKLGSEEFFKRMNAAKTEVASLMVFASRNRKKSA